MIGEGRVLDIALRSDASAVAAARRALDSVRGALPDDVFDDVRLLLSELVTNSVRHASADPGDPIEVSLRVTDRHVHAEVTDRGSGFAIPPPRPPATVEGSGWGLYLVQRIADRWGTRAAHGRSCVWFDIDLAAV